MTADYDQDRIKEIYAAYSQNTKTRDWNIRLTPINGGGDIQATLTKPNNWNDRIKKERIIKETDSLEILFNSDFF